MEVSKSGTRADIYLRLSVEELNRGESSSIGNQREIIRDYCHAHGITIVKEFVDDGYSGGNFQRPGFLAMLRHLDDCHINMVITKDLSRLGRDMAESSQYAERYFPERGIRYLTISDNFDSQNDNVLAPFQFAMNDVYIRDASRKVKAVLNQKRKQGKYCACPPFGYKKEQRTTDHLVPDETTAPIVKQIFALAADGVSTRGIAAFLNHTNTITPLKYRVEYRDNFSERGAAHVAEEWNNTTVKRILQNQVYLGHTILGKTKKASVKSSKKISVPQADWCITEHTHEPLVTPETFSRAAETLQRNTRTYHEAIQKHDDRRISIFRGLVFCAACGGAMCSGGTVYRDNRLAYWYLNCTNIPKRARQHCENGARIRYDTLVQIVKHELNALISLSDEEIGQIIQKAVRREESSDSRQDAEQQRSAIQKEIADMDKIIEKLYRDNLAGSLSDARLASMVQSLEEKTKALNTALAALNARCLEHQGEAERYQRFFAIAARYTEIDTLTPDILHAFIDKIVIARKTKVDGQEEQDIDIFYKFIGKLNLSSSFCGN